jgi:hypothetical protein
VTLVVAAAAAAVVVAVAAAVVAAVAARVAAGAGSSRRVGISLRVDVCGAPLLDESQGISYHHGRTC